MNHEPKKECFKTSVGGQALMEGIMMRGPKQICCAVRKPDGTIETRSGLRRMPMTWHGPSMLLLIKVLFAVSTISAMREFVPGMISR